MAFEKSHIKDLCFIGSHNTFTGILQLFTPASVRYLKSTLKEGYRVVELDVFNDKNHNPIITHNTKWQKSFPFRDAIEAIAKYGFFHTDLPLFVFIQDQTNSKEALENMADICGEFIGERLINSSGLSQYRLEELSGRVIFISNKINTNSSEWNSCLSERISHGDYTEVKNSRMDAPLSVVGKRLTRVYPKNYLLSRNPDYEKWIGVANFVCVNTTFFFNRSYKKRNENFISLRKGSTK